MYQIPEELIAKYAINGPRYTSYPTFPVWKDATLQDQKDWYETLRGTTKPLSLYFHIPFCKERCTYCGCNTMITNNYNKALNYVDYILKELDTMAEFGLGSKKIRQLHFGGGTPTFLEDSEFTAIMDRVRKHFEFEEGAEIAIEVDPCVTRPGQLEFLAEQGFNRISLGVQDIDPKVQEAVNRVQPVELTREHIVKARALGFKGVNCDLIYGLPYQTYESFQNTIETIISLKPDRMALYNFAFLPERFANHKLIDPATLPNEKIKVDIMFSAIRRFTEQGYQYIGMDHFALETDELSVAQRNHKLHRNFMGYSPKSGVDLLGVGVSSIGESDDFFIQNEKKLSNYENLIHRNGLAGDKGIRLSDDDKIRKWTILQLMCNFYLSFSEFEAKFGVNFKEYFKTALEELVDMQNDNLLVVHEDDITIKPYGKIVIRNICMKFDAYLKGDNAPKAKFSKTL